MTTKITILGGGAMGTGCSIVLSERPDQEVTIWMRNPEYVKKIRETRENERLLPGVQIPKSVHITADIEEAVRDADYIVVAIPSIYLRESLEQIAPFLSPTCPMISVVKGLENETHFRPSEIIADVVGDRAVAAIGGPSHAEEFARRLPASVVAASGDRNLAKQVQSMFSTDRFRVYTNLDLIGVELAGALKNVIAIAAGISEGLKYGDNAKSSLLTRGQVEMTRFGVAFGAEQDTFYGLAGMGDLITTCFSPFGRNRSVGELLGQGKTLSEILGNMDAVAEGVKSARAVYELADVRGIEMPISTEVYRVLFEEKSPAEATNSLMKRPLQEE